MKKENIKLNFIASVTAETFLFCSASIRWLPLPLTGRYLSISLSFCVCVVALRAVIILFISKSISVRTRIAVIRRTSCEHEWINSSKFYHIVSAATLFPFGFVPFRWNERERAVGRRCRAHITFKYFIYDYGLCKIYKFICKIVQFVFIIFFYHSSCETRWLFFYVYCYYGYSQYVRLLYFFRFDGEIGVQLTV